MIYIVCLNIDPQAPANFIDHFNNNTVIWQLWSAHPKHSTNNHHNQDQLPEFCMAYSNAIIDHRFLVQGTGNQTHNFSHCKRAPNQLSPLDV